MPAPIHRSEASVALASPTAVPRPGLVRRETDQILSYYQSEHAGRTPDYLNAAEPAQDPPPSAQASSHSLAGSPGSDYSSQYSFDESASRAVGAPAVAPTGVSGAALPAPDPRAGASGTATAGAPGAASSVRSDARHSYSHSRRPSVPTEGGADRRRMAIVEMDASAAPPPLALGRKRSQGRRGHAPSASVPAPVDLYSSSPLGARDTPHNSSNSSNSDNNAHAMVGGPTLFARRGVHIGGLALVAPADTSPRAYRDLQFTPPSTAPVSSGSGGSSSVGVPSAFLSHARSASEAVDPSRVRARLQHKPSRDVGIVGLSSASTASESQSPASPTSSEYAAYAEAAGLGLPLFQTPGKDGKVHATADADAAVENADSQFRAGHGRLLSTPLLELDMGQDGDESEPCLTPAIGQPKHISQPVVGPVIVGLDPGLLPRARSSAQPTPSPRSGGSSVHSASPHPPSPYLSYQPGIHATAGPLPPPPRSIFEPRDTNPPPRPPRLHTPLPASTRRDIDAIKESLRLPQSVSAKLASRTPTEEDKPIEATPPPRPDSREESRSQESAYSDDFDQEPSIKLVSAPPVHKREGAFPPSKILTSPPRTLIQSPESSHAPLPIDPEPSSSTSHHSGAHPLVVIQQEESPERRPALDLHREGSWVSLKEQSLKRHSSPNGKSSALAASLSRSPSVSAASSCSSVSHLPSLPPKSVRNGSDEEKNGSLAPSAFKALVNLKRFSSLPRTPSRSSKSSRRSSGSDPRRSLSPPPPAPPPHIFVESPPRKRAVPKVRYSHAWPPAMSAADVVVLKSSRERAQGYAMKINELSMYDCGLRDWMASQQRGSVSQPTTQARRSAHHVPHASLPAEFGGMPAELRHNAHGSLASEATFPVRADAYTATDLSPRPIDVAPSTAPPPILPYPALAQAQRSPARSSALLSPTKSILPLPLSGAKGSGTGFFASLGRKTSIRKSDKATLQTLNPHGSGGQAAAARGVLTKQRPIAIALSQSSPPPPRPAPTPGAHGIPGGPRAAPGHIQRAKTFSISPPAPAPAPSPPTPASAPPQQALVRTQTMAPSGPRGPSPSKSPSTSPQRQSAGASTTPTRRPSLFARARPGHASVVTSPVSSGAGAGAGNAGAGAPGPVPNAHRGLGVSDSDGEFQLKLNRLAELVPDANRDVLAGYLRRAGDDILAIGLYIEDEKQGTIRTD